MAVRAICVCVLMLCAIAVWAEPIRTPGFHRVLERQKQQKEAAKLQPQPQPSSKAAPKSAAEPSRFQQKTASATQTKTKAKGKRDCPSGYRKVGTVMPEYKKEKEEINPISPSQLNNAVKNAMSLTFSPIPLPSLTGIAIPSSKDLTDSLLATSSGEAAAPVASQDTAAAATGAEAPTGSEGTPVDGSTGESDVETGGCPMSEEEMANVPADMYGHEAFSNTLKTAQETWDQQEDAQWKSDTTGGYDYHTLLNSADKLLEQAQPYLGAEGAAAATDSTPAAATESTTPAASTETPAAASTESTTPAASTETPAASTETPATPTTETPAASSDSPPAVET